MFIIPSHLCSGKMPGGLSDQLVPFITELRIILELIMRHAWPSAGHHLYWTAQTVDEWLAAHPDEEVGIAKPLNGILNTGDRPQGNLGIQRIDHTGDKSVHQSVFT